MLAVVGCLGILGLTFGAGFYAGRYCQACWDGGVRAQEAAENYD